MTAENIYISDANTLQAEFAERHSIILTPLVQRESDAIYWTTRTKLEIDTGLPKYVDELNQVDPIWSLLLSMLERTFEYVEGAIRCICYWLYSSFRGNISNSRRVSDKFDVYSC
ncbi:MAG: hypothetical protein V7K90_19430 [Nostoc sp.]|uniref:hypothetical protein n=1 Tax=Nostoc sp. TaxID=1180 RepID=UPI002FFAECC5